MKNNSGVTLLEILIAISLLTLVLFCGSGIYISGMNLYTDAQDSTQAYRNAQIVMMHMEKYARDAATTFSVFEDLNNNDVIKMVGFTSYNINSPDFFSKDPTIIRQYAFIKSKKQIILDIYDLEKKAINNGQPEQWDPIIFNHINDCEFESIIQNNEVVLRIRIVAEDNKGKNTYELNSYIAAGLTASPNMYEQV